MSIQHKQEVELNSHFRLVFTAVSFLTIISLAAAVFMSFYFESPSTQQATLIETCSTTWKIGFGTIIGLFGTRKPYTF